MNVIFIFNIRIQDYYKFNWPRYKNFKQKYPDDVNMISEIAVNTRKSMFDGNKLVNGNSKNERVARAQDRAIT